MTIELIIINYKTKHPNLIGNKLYKMSWKLKILTLFLQENVMYKIII